jgi:hypothetical protein
MSFIHGISHLTEQGYKYTDVRPVHYPEQDKAIEDLRMEQAAALYWQVVCKTDDRGLACNYIRYMLSPEELQSDDFAHILLKRQPALLSRRDIYAE